jgi:predicted transcriptional regulator
MPETVNRILTLTTQIAAAYVSANAVDVTAVPGLIQDVHLSLSGLDGHRPGGASRLSRPLEPPPAVRPAVDIQKSVFADHLVCLEDGKTFKTLTRHLGEIHRMTPAQYRAKWDLPESYPMIAPNYAVLRSKLSSQIRRGKHR